MSNDKVKGNFDLKVNKDYEILEKDQVFTSNILEMVSDIPSVAQTIIESSDKSNQHVYEMLKKDQDMINKMIEKELEKENPSQEQLDRLLKESQKIRDDAKETNTGTKAYNKEVLILVGGLMVGVISTMIAKRNIN